LEQPSSRVGVKLVLHERQALACAIRRIVLCRSTLMWCNAAIEHLVGSATSIIDAWKTKP
jgi:hypothetical protein